MNILVICPTKAEYQHFKDALKKAESLHHHYIPVESGVGKVNAGVAIALKLFSPTKIDLVAVIGYAAGYGKYSQGDFVAPSCAMYHDANCPKDIVPELTSIYDLQGSDECICYTGDSFVTKDSIPSLVRPGQSCIFDMEATAVCQVADQTDTPVIVLKEISDTPLSDNTNAQTFAEYCTTHTDFSRFIWWLEAL